MKTVRKYELTISKSGTGKYLWKLVLSNPPGDHQVTIDSTIGYETPERAANEAENYLFTRRRPDDEEYEIVRADEGSDQTK